MTRAIAHPNIALIKYWGKQERAGNLPATPSLSITLDKLETVTELQDADKDTFVINGAEREDAKVSGFLQRLRQQFDVPPLLIQTQNNFPTGAGLASSASGFAALMCAINEHASLRLNPEYMSEWARQGSASAARSHFGGFVSLVPPIWRAQPAAPASHWDIRTLIAITDTSPKSVSSTSGMNRSRETSPYYNAWVRSSGEDFTNASDALSRRDFTALGAATELSCLKMHSVMLTSVPTLAYWNETTLRCMNTVRALRADDVESYFTIDAGPQLKAICEPRHEDDVASALLEVEGVLDVLRCGLGEGARISS